MESVMPDNIKALSFANIICEDIKQIKNVYETDSEYKVQVKNGRAIYRFEMDMGVLVVKGIYDGKLKYCDVVEDISGKEDVKVVIEDNKVFVLFYVKSFSGWTWEKIEITSETVEERLFALML